MSIAETLRVRFRRVVGIGIWFLRSPSVRTAVVALFLGSLSVSLPLCAQAPSGSTPAPPDAPLPIAFEAFAGSELEDYLRTLQNVGRVGPHPWSIRGFSARQVRWMARPDSAHPWDGRYRLGAVTPDGGPADAEAGSSNRFEYGWIQPRVRGIFNSAFPFGAEEGPTWAGRGLTTEARFGGYVRYGPLSLVVTPTAFRAENRAFELAPTGLPGVDGGIYMSPLSRHLIDHPQRFGPEPYARLDPGNSTLRLDLWGVSLGFSTAAQAWGPQATHPLVLGPNAGGFPHVFAGTEHPVNLLLGDLHFRYIVGRLEQTSYAPETDLAATRVAPGLVMTFLPRGLNGLEFGLSRFIHREWPEEGIGRSEILQPLEFKFKENLPGADTRFPDNQLFSLFARWNLPEAGFEIFGEFFRVDAAFDARVLSEEPDDLSGHALGIRRVWDGEGRDPLTVFRAESLTALSSHRERGGARQFFAYRARPMYQHEGLRQGHTHRGQLLASPAGQGGRALIAALDRYDPRGRWTIELERRLIRDRTVGRTPSEPEDVHVRYVAGVSGLRFRGSFAVEAEIRGVYDMNRYLRSEDAFNLSVVLGGTLLLK